MRLCLLLGVAALPACHHDGEENLGLNANRRDVAVDVGALAGKGELEKVLALPSTEIQRRLGAHRFTGAARFAVESGETRDVLDETWRLEVDAAGSSHLVHDNSHGYGSEAVAVGNVYFVRPRYGRFVRRSPEGDEVERARDDVAGTMGGYLAVLGRFATRTVESATVGGRRALRVRLALAAAPEAFSDGDPAHAWRASIEPSALDGEVLVDQSTGAPLGERLSATYQAKNGERVIATTIAFHAEIEPAASVAVVAPADSAPSPSRPRPLLDRQTLLNGLGGKPVRP